MRQLFAIAWISMSCSSHGDHATVDGAGSGSGGPCDHALTTASCWALAPDQDGGSSATQYAGGAYDGHYIYFAPYIGLNAQQQYVTSGTVARVDPTADFTSTSAQTTFDTTTLDPNAQGYQGAVFDGRYVYFVPDVIGMPDSTVSDNGVMARFDTTGDFTDGSAWTTYDLLGSAQVGEAFRGDAFDGRYLYLPVFETTIARYDTTADFATPASWTSFNASIGTSSPDLDMDGAVFDGRYVYFPPGDATNVVARYDTTTDFGSAASWTVFDLSAVSAHAQDYVGGAFDGRYLYFAPSLGAPIVRFDTTAEFTTAASWSTFDPTPLAHAAGESPGGDNGTTQIGFQGAGFDGRYVYFVPYLDAPASRADESSGQVFAYDTTGDFTATTSWTSFDTRGLDPNAGAYFGAVFDGRYLYVPPSSIEGGAARFDASPATEPNLPAFHGSFF